MSSRVTYLINTECEIYVTRLSKDCVRVRITEDPSLPDPTEIELEGNILHILDALSSVAMVLANVEKLFQQEPN
jgi:hypothetical protein